MTVINKLMNKSGIASIKIAKMFFSLNVKDKIPTVSQISKDYSLPRGTVQNAIKNLSDLNAIKLQANGYKGTTIIEKDNKALLEICGIQDISGIMPFPYSKRHEGLASGLTVTLEKNEIPVYLAYMRGAKKRMKMVQQGRYNFAIVSKLAASEYIKENDDLAILMNLGTYSYISKHIICFHDKKATEIKDGMKVGLDSLSFDSAKITKSLCEGKKVTFVPMEYYQAVSKVINGEIDAVVTNIDEINDSGIKINHVDVDVDNGDDNEAVIVVLKESSFLNDYLRTLININTVLDTQKMVVEKKLRIL